MLTQHDVNQGSIAIDRAIQFPPLGANPEIRLVNKSAATDLAVDFATKFCRQNRRQLGFPLPH